MSRGLNFCLNADRITTAARRTDVISVTFRNYLRVSHSDRQFLGIRHVGIEETELAFGRSRNNGCLMTSVHVRCKLQRNITV